MQYSVRKAKDAYGELKDTLDTIMSRYDFIPITPGSDMESFVEVPDGKIFYMTLLEVQNASSGDIEIHIEDDSGNKRSVTYKVSAGSILPIKYVGSGFTGKLHFVIDTGSYGSVTFRPAGYLGDK